MRKLKQLFLNTFPIIGKYKRFSQAFFHAQKLRDSYAQHGEDVFIYSLLAKAGINKGFYVDVGANHPTYISNTYLLYRKGFSGVIIEPNDELINLFRIFRKRDIPICVGCSNESVVLPFFINKRPALSTFIKDHKFKNKNNTASIRMMPLLTLDNCMKHIDFPRIDFLSIDVEGLNKEVLMGATDTLLKTYILSVEFDAKAELDSFQQLLPNFRIEKIIACNAILVNESFDKLPSS